MHPRSSPIRYFPLANGRYETTPQLFPLATDFGNGPLDQRIFQFATDWPDYAEAKQAAWAAAPARHYCQQGFHPELRAVVVQTLLERLVQEYPERFELTIDAQGVRLHSATGQELLALDARYQLQPGTVWPDSFAALAMQVPEDVIVLHRPAAHEPFRNIALHLCFPNHWAAEAKVGLDFAATHAPVPDMQRVSRQGDRLLESMMRQGPHVRFAWGLATDCRLNHHPQPPDGHASRHWQGRHFNPRQPALYLRVERQTSLGIAQQNSLLFLIRTHFYDVAEVKRDLRQRQALTNALQGMSASSLAYKGLAQSRDAILRWLNE